MTEGNGSFESVDLSWPLDGTTVDGTLVRPSGPGPFPGVVLVAGSGPTDRDWNSPLLPGTNGSARLLAEALAVAGFASLRFDKRVSGPHARENIQALTGWLSMASHEEEVASAVHRLATQPYVSGATASSVWATARGRCTSYTTSSTSPRSRSPGCC